MKIFTVGLKCLTVGVLILPSLGPTELAWSEDRVHTTPVVERDNSGTNQRDRRASEWTAMDQGNSKRDIEITSRIRQDLVKDDSLSTYAENIKVITHNGRVVLKGPVRTAEERSRIEKVALLHAGAGKVSNQIDVSLKN